MAKTEVLTNNTQRKVFNAVLSHGLTRPPKRLRTQQVKPEAHIETITASIKESLRTGLGIGEDGIAYGFEPPSNQRPSFQAPLNVCEPMTYIREWTKQDRLALEQVLSHMPALQYLETWRNVVGSENLKMSVANALHQLVPEYVTWAYSGYYRDDSLLHLKYWIQNIFTDTIRFFLSRIDPDASVSDDPVIGNNDIQKWQEMALTRLGALRVDDMFSMIVEWDEEVNGIDDLKQFITSPATRSYLTTRFSEALSTRLLHPGASTIEILQLYISIIRAFRRLDPRGVLLDRVARRVRRYLRERDDTVKVIVTGLLSDAYDENGDPLPSDSDTLTELAFELMQRDADGRNDDSEFDWNNMEWMPDPIDAAPDYLKSKNTDIIGSLTSLFESKDIFVKELQTMLAERLLRNKPNYDQEISVIEHLKIRFSDAALQSCEIMLKDVLDSRKVDSVIRRDQRMQDEASKPSGFEPEVHAKILSRLFWPTMSEQPFKVPELVRQQQELYERGFETLKQSRKLTWINSVGQVEVELDLEDRIFRAEVPPSQASVIYAFSGSEGESITKSVDELSSELEMSEALVRSACMYWTSKRILAETSKDNFIVLERLPEGDDTVMTGTTGQQDAALTAAAEAAAAQAAKEVEEAERKQKMAMYHQFIINMLTNQGALPLPRIAMMLGIVVPGGFPFSNEELKEFLSGMVRDGVIEIGHGGAYKKAS